MDPEKVSLNAVGRGRLKERRSPPRPCVGAKVTVTPASDSERFSAHRLRPPWVTRRTRRRRGRPLQPLMRIYLLMAISKRPQRVLRQHFWAGPRALRRRSRSSAPLADAVLTRLQIGPGLSGFLRNREAD